MAKEILKDIKSNHDLWVENKTKYLGSGDAPDAVWNKLNLFMRKRALLGEKELTEPMRWGTLLEPNIAQRATEVLIQQGQKVELKDLNTCYGHDKLPWMVATPDFGIVRNGELGLLECKLVTSFGARAWELGVSDRAAVQVAHQLEVCDFAGFVIVAALFVPEFEIRTFEITRNDDVTKQLISHEAEAWACIQTGTLPSVTVPDTEITRALFPKANGETIVLPDDAETLLEGLKYHHEQRKSHERTEEQLKAELQLLMRDSYRAVLGKHELTWANVTTPRFDQKKFEREHPDLFKQYQGVTETRRFTHRVREDQ